MQLIDTHVHINFEVFQGELAEIANRWREAGVSRLVHSCVTPGEFQSIRSIADQFSEVSFAVGLHPLDTKLWTNETAQEIHDLAKLDHRIVAIGETGLDFYKADNIEIQKEALKSQLEIAYQLNKPVIIHCREAAAACREIFLEWGSKSKPIRGVMHCWGGNPEETQWFLDLGFYISFSGIVTFKGAKQVQASAAMVPLNRLLIETDCPFLAPVPKRGKRNEPSYVKYVAECLAKLREEPLETIAQQTTQNAMELFDLPVNLDVN